MEQHNFDDIQPLPLSPEGISVATILYSDDYKLKFGLLRALQEKLEYSERALYLTEEVIKLNAAHYTVWQYRYNNVLKLNKDINQELNWVEEIALDNVKNYQIWHYRQLLLTHLNEKDAKREFPIIEVMLDDDSKNYHVWSYRKWVVQWSRVWDYELDFVEKFIDEDVYNNSAWSHRYFSLFGNNQTITNDELDREVEYTKNKIALAPQNVSPWNYLIGIYEKLNKPLESLEGLALEYSDVFGDDEKFKSKPALELLVKIYKEKKPELAIKGLDLLADKYDTIRANYWNYQKSLVV